MYRAFVTEETQRNLLEGPSAYALARVRTKYTAYWLGLPVATAILSFSGVWIQWPMTTLSVTVAITMMPLLYLVQATVNKAGAEVEAGYTTFPENHVNLEQRDPYLGRVIRKPDERYLESDRFKEIASLAQAELTRAQGGRRRWI